MATVASSACHKWFVLVAVYSLTMLFAFQAYIDMSKSCWSAEEARVSNTKATIPVPFSMTDYCSLKRNSLKGENVSSSVKKALTITRNVYIGSSGLTWFGWESYTQHELDVTVIEDFARYFCPGDIQAFLSEHTFEHISMEGTRQAFKNFFEFLTPGGHVRTAIPAYSTGWKPTKEEQEIGHVNIITADELVDLMEGLGYVDVRKLEWMDNERKMFHTTLWNVCEGPVRRTVQFDPRNQEFLRKRYQDLNMSTDVKPPLMNSFVADNTFPVRELGARSTVVQGHKPKRNSH